MKVKLLVTGIFITSSLIAQRAVNTPVSMFHADARHSGNYSSRGHKIGGL